MNETLYENDFCLVFRHDGYYLLHDLRDNFKVLFLPSEADALIRNLKVLNRKYGRRKNYDFALQDLIDIQLEYSNYIKAKYIKEYIPILEDFCINNKEFSKKDLKNKSIGYLLNLYKVINKRKERKDETSSSSKRA